MQVLSHDNLVVQYLKSIFGEAKSIVNFQDRRLAWANKSRNLLSIFKTGGLLEPINPSPTVEDTPKFFPHVVRFELKIAVNLLLTEEKRKANLWLRTQIKHWGGCRSLWKPIEGGLVQSDYYCYYCNGWRNLMRKTADSPFEIQINLAYCLLKSNSKPISLSEIAWSSWQRTLRGRCNYLNLWGKRGRSRNSR